MPFVTLCYRRPRRLPDWPYNLFTMIHGRSREAVLEQVTEVERVLGLGPVAHAVLFSGRRFKQRGALYRGPDSAPGPGSLVQSGAAKGARQSSLARRPSVPAPTAPLERGASA